MFAASMRPRLGWWLILLIGLCGTIAAFRAALHVTNGLQGEYFLGDRPSTVPAIDTISTVVSTSRMTAAWSESVPPVFHVRWFGYLIINRPGRYTLATTSDDGSSVKVDGSLVVENGGVHGSRTRTGQIELGEGPHFVLIEYFQAGGSYEMTWLWAQDGGQLSLVPPWVTSPQRISSSRALIAHRLDQLCMIALAGLVSVTAWAVFAYGRVLT